MKRIISFLLLFSVMFSGIVYAENSFEIYDVSISYDPVGDAINVSGFVNTSKTELMIVVKVEKDGNITQADEFFAEDLVDGNLHFNFENINFDESAEDGIYDIYISSKYTPVSHHTYEYKGGDTLFGIMKDIQDYTAAKKFPELMDVIDNNQEQLGIDNSFYGTLNDSEMKLFKDVLLSKTYALKEADEYENTVQRKNAVKTEVANLISYYEEGMAVVELGRIKTVNELLEWTSKYEDTIELNEDSKLYKYFNEVKSSSEFMAHLKVNRTVDSKEEARKIIYENVMLTLIETKYYTISKEVVESYEEYFSIDKSSYNKLTAAKKSEIYSNLEGKFYNTAKDVSKALNEYVLKYLDNSSSGDNKSEWGGGSGGGGGLSAMGSIINTSKDGVVPDEKVENLIGLTDLKDASWAEEAISELYKKGVVSGYNNKFEPNSNVTRAQFVKMILLAAGKSINSKYEASFSDVSENDWYAPYVSAAKRFGIVMGDNEGRFNPDSFITRQDMAVIIYRTFGLRNTNVECALADFNSVSDYAKDAVKTLFEQKVINGYENGKFAPFNNATRAEAAQMLYNIIQ